MPNPPGPPPPLYARALAKPPAQRNGTDLHILHMWNTNQWDKYTAEVLAQRPGTPATPAAPPTQTQADVDKLNAQHDAITILTDLFTSYGLASLVPKITEYIQQGVSSDAVSVLLSQTAEYKQRFAANDARIAAGLPALSPASYIAAETSYRQIMASAGLPSGFYDQPSDFTSFIAKDIAPTELQSRVNAATDAIRQAPSQTLDYFRQWYSDGDLVAFALDPNKAAPLVEQRLKAAEAAGYASSNGVNDLDQATAERIGGQSNIGLQQLQQGFGFIGQEKPTTDKLSQIYGGNETSQDLVNEVFFDDAQATVKRQKLASQERAAFAGSSGAASSASLASEKSV